jgi:Spy/CpxP family protein refolding chaperone
MKFSDSVVRKFIMASLLAFSIPLAANAEPQLDEGAGHHGAPEKSFGHHFGHAGEEFHFPSGLDLSETQRDKIFSIKHTQEALFYEQGKIIRKAHIDLHTLAASEQYDDEKAKAISDKLGKALATITFLRVQERHQIVAVLTPEQRNFLKSLRQEHSGGHPRIQSHEDGKSGTPSHPQ